VDNFPDNSHQAKARPTEKAEQEPKKIEPIVTGQVIRRKPPLGKRFMATFFGGTARSAVASVATDVLLPAFRDTVADAFSQAVERMIYGEARSSSRRTGARPSGSNGYVSYNRYAPTSPTRREDPRDRDRNPSRQARASHNFDEIILATRTEAEDVLSGLFDILTRYESTSVADLYSLVGISAEFTDNDWGWTDIRGTGIVRVGNGYLLDLPRPESLK